MDKGIEALRTAAEGAGSDEWMHSYIPPFGKHFIVSRDGSTIINLSEGDVPAKCVNFIVEACPANILKLIAALEQAQQECQTIEQKLINAAVYIETLESEPRKTNLKQLNEIAGLKRKCEELEAASIKPVNMPDAYAIRPGHPINEDERSVMIPKDGGNWYSRLDIEHALRVAGVKFDGGE